MTDPLGAGPMADYMRALPDRGAGGVLDLRRPGAFDQLGDVVRHRHVVELAGHSAAVLVGPVEEVEHRLGHVGLLLALVHQDEAGAGDRPAAVARLVGEQQVEAGGVGPVGVGRRGLERLAARGDELAGVVLEQGEGELVLQRVGVLDVADGAVDAAGVRGHALVALAADAGGPVHRGLLAHLGLPVRAHLGEVVGEDEGGAGAVGAVDDGDRPVGQGDARVELLDGGVVPLGDLAQVDVGEDGAGELELAGRDPLDVHHRHHAAHDHRELHQAGLVQLGGLERLVGGAEVDGLGLDLLDAAAGADRLVVHADAGLGLVGVRPLGVDRVREGGAGAGDVGRPGRGGGHQAGRDQDGGNEASHETATQVFTVSLLGSFGLESSPRTPYAPGAPSP